VFDQFLEQFRKATESTLQIQSELFRQWVQPWTVLPGVPTRGAAVGEGGVDQAQTYQKNSIEGVTDLLTRYRETCDAQYRAGIQIVEDAFHIFEAKDPEQFRKLVEELWRHSIEGVKSVAESQLRYFQATVVKGFDVTSRGLTVGNA